MFNLQDRGPGGWLRRAQAGWLAALIFTVLAAGSALAQPANDNFANAAGLAGNFGATSGNNVNATSELGEPIHAGSGGGKSVWYKWTASFTGTITFNTQGSSFDTVMAAYVGTNVATLTLVAQNDDANFPADITSSVSFPVVQGSNYLIAVDGFLGDSGAITLNWHPIGTFSAGNFFISAPAVPSVFPPGNVYAAAQANYGISEKDSVSPAARMRITRTGGSSGRVRVNYLVTNVFYTNFLQTNIYGTNLFITNRDTNMNPVLVTFSNIFVTNFFTSNLIQNYTPSQGYFWCPQVSGIQLPPGAQAGLTNTDQGPGTVMMSNLVVNPQVPCVNRSTTNTVTNGTVITTVLSNVFCTNVVVTQIVASASNMVDYISTSGTIIFNDFQMGADIPLSLTGSEGLVNRLLWVKITSVALDPGETASIAPPTVDPVSGTGFLTLFTVSQGSSTPPADPCLVTNAIVNMAQTLYTINENNVTLIISAIRRGTNLTGTSTVTYTVGGDSNNIQQTLVNNFALQPGSDYANPNPPNPNIPSSQPPDFAIATGTITFNANSTTAVGIPVRIIPNNLVKFNQDIHVTLSNPQNCVLGQVPAASVTLLFNNQPAGAVDRSHNPNSVSTSTPPFIQSPGANNIVYAAAVQPDGKTVFTGDFTDYNTVPRNRVARMNLDGSLDTGFLTTPNSGANDSVTCLTLQPDAKVIIGGSFTSFNGTNRHGIARLNADGSLDAAFNTGLGVNGIVWSTVLQPDGKVLIAGSFSQVNGTNRNSIARLNSDGSLDPSFDPGIGPDDTINTLAIQPDGRVLIGGDFTTLDNTNVAFLARLDTNGNYDASFNTGSGLDGSVFALVVQPNGKILAGGSFTSINQVGRGKIARLNADGSLDATFDPGSGANDTVYTVALQADGKVLLGGLFTSYNSTRRVCIARVLSYGSLDTTFLDTAYNQFAGIINPFAGQPNNFLFTIAPQASGNVIIGGSFNQVGGGFTREDIRPRLNISSLLGGSTPGPGNIKLASSSYNVDKFGGQAYITMTRINGGLGPASVTVTPAPGSALPGQDYIFQTFHPFWTTTYPGGGATLSWDFADAYIGPNNAAVDIAVPPTKNPADIGTADVFIPIINNTNSTGNLSLDVNVTQPQSSDIFFLGGDNIPIGVALDTQVNSGLTIVDNTVPHGVIGFSSPTYSVDENGTNAQITLVRSNGSSGLVTVQFATVGGGTAVAGPTNDYIATNASVTFNTGQTNKTILVRVINNGLVQPDKTVNLALSIAGGGATLGQTNAVLTIVNDNFAAGHVKFTSTNYTAHETDGAATISAVRTGGSQGSLSVTYVSSDGTASNNINYGAVSNVLTWNSGDTSIKNFAVPLIHDQLVTSNLSLNIRLTNPVVAGVTNYTALNSPPTNTVLNIVNDDFFGSPTLSAPSYFVNGNSGVATITVNRLGGSSQTMTVNYATTNGTGPNAAFTPLNYLATSGTLVFNPGEFSKSFTVQINDSPGQGNLFFSVLLSSPTPSSGPGGGVTLGNPSNATVTIVDETLTVQPPGSIDTTMDPSAGFNAPVFALALQSDGRMIAGGDFTVANAVPRNRIARLNKNGGIDAKFSSVTEGMDGSVRSLAIQSDGRILVSGLFTTINGVNRQYFGRLNIDGGVDTSFDPGSGADNPVYTISETFLGSPTNSANRRVIIGGSFVSVDGLPRNNIARLNNDGSVDNAFAPAGANGTVYAVAIYSTNDPVNSGRILLGGDFTSVNGVSRNHIARLNVDGSLDLGFNPGAGPNDSVRAIAIQVDGKVLIGGLFTAVNASGLNRIARLNQNGTVDPSFNPGVGADGVVSCITIQQDHKILVGGSFTHANGVTRNRLTRLNEDGSVDPSINFGLGADNFVSAMFVQPDDKIVIGGGFTTFNGANTPSIARIYGRSIVGSGALQFTAPNYQVVENQTNVVIGVQRSGGTAGSASVQFSTSNGTAIAGSNYTGITNTLVFPAGETFQTVNVPIIDDTVINPDRSVILTLSNPSGAALGGLANSQVTIVNDDAGVNFLSPTYSIIKNVVGGTAIITIQRSGSSIGPASVDFFTGISGTATAGIDYTPVSNTVFFADGETTETASVPIINNGLIEGNKTVELGLANATNGLLLNPSSALLTIIDNNLSAGSLTFSSTAYTAPENSGATTISVIRTNGSIGQVSVNFAASGGTAIVGLDYVATNGALTFFDGETNKSFQVQLVHNPSVQGDRTVNLTLSNPTGGAQILSPNPVALTIQDVDIGLAFDQQSYFVTETNGIVTIAVRRLSGTNGAVSVHYATSNSPAGPGVAIAGTDYIATSGTLNFASGETFKTFDVQILRNLNITGSQIFQINLSNPSGTGQLVTPSTAAVTILDVDSGLAFATNAVTTSESNGVVSIPVLRTGNTVGAIAVNFATSDGTAVAGTRYVATNGVLNFADGQVSNSFNVALINDNLVQGDQTVNLSLLNPTNGAQLLAPSNAVLTITDDDAGFAFSSASYAVGEGGVFATIPVIRTGFLSSSVSVNFATSDGTAHQPAKYTATNGTLLFGPGETNKSFNVSVIDNSTIEGNQTVNLSLSSPSTSSSLQNPNAAVLTIVDNDGSQILPAGAALIGETGAGAPNGGVDPGETVTLLLALRNALGQNTTSLVATLLSTNGVTAPSGPQNYGVLVTNGPSVSRQFQFTANGTNGAQVTAVLQLQDGATNLGTATFAFTLGRVTNTFNNPGLITINDNAPATPYPSTLNVSGLAGSVGQLTASVSNLNHGDISDVSILLVGPTGTNTLLMAKIGGAHTISGVNLTFDDSGPALTANAPVSGTYRPTQFSTNVPFPASTNGGGFLPQPFGTQLAAFTNSNPNGTWSLFVLDDTGLDAGSINAGWTLKFATVSSVPAAVDLVAGLTASTNVSVVNSNLVYTITVTNAGPSTATGVTITDILPPGAALVSSSTTQGTWTNSSGTMICSVGTLVKDATLTATLTVNPGLLGPLTNTVSLNSAVVDANAANNSATVITTISAPTADLAVGVISVPNPVLIGSNVTYTITVTNLGPGTASTVVATNSLPAGISFVSINPPGIGTNSSGTIVANLGTLGSGAIGTFSVTAKPAATGTYTNSASAGSSVTDPLKGNNKASVKTDVQLAQLGISSSPGHLTFTWPTSVTGYVLESTPTLTPPNWTVVTNSPPIVGGFFTVTVPTTGPGGFYRLHTILP